MMIGEFVDLLLEPILWLIVSGIITILAIFFILKYRKIEEEAKPFIFGLILFICCFLIARTIETIRRYWIGSYYDIIDSHFSITGLNLALRLSYYIIAWSGITIFYYVFETHIMKEGMQKNTWYILTIFSALEGIFSCFLYFTSATDWVMFCVIGFFFVVAFFPVFLFLYTAKMAISRRQRVAWIGITIGFLIFVLGVMADLPEAYLVVTEYMGLEYFPPVFIHYGTPIMQAMGTVLMGIGFAVLYENI